MNQDKLMAVHPGEILLEEFLKPMNLEPNQVALALGVSVSYLEEIIGGRQSINADFALRLARYFNMSPRFWLGLQMDYDLDVAEDELRERLDREVAILGKEGNR